MQRRSHGIHPIEMVQKITQRIHDYPGLGSCDIFTSLPPILTQEERAFLNIPGLGEALAGPYDKEIAQLLYRSDL